MRLEDYTINKHNNENLPKDIAWKKHSGWITLNGNVRSEWDLIWFTKQFLNNPKTKNNYLNNTKKTLLITAGFEAGKELDDKHIRSHYTKNNINWNNISNLEVLTEFYKFKNSQEGHFANEYINFTNWMKNRFDLNKPNSDLLFKIHTTLHKVRQDYPSIQLQDLFYASEPNIEKKINLIWNKTNRNTRENRISQTFDFLNKCPFTKKNIRNYFNQLKEYDNWFFNEWEKETNKFFNNTKIENNHHWNHIRNKLNDKIINSASIFLWGGNWEYMLNVLNFFKLDKSMQYAKSQGTNFYGMSAGTLIMADRVYDLSQRTDPKGFIIPHRPGLNLTKNLTYYTHIQDFKHIRDNNYDTQTTISLRTNNPTLGLIRNSVALIDHDTIYSIGSDPVYLFDDRGWKYELNSNENIRKK